MRRGKLLIPWPVLAATLNFPPEHEIVRGFIGTDGLHIVIKGPTLPEVPEGQFPPDIRAVQKTVEDPSKTRITKTLTFEEIKNG